MDVKTLCLGLLSIREASGYDLKKHAESAGDALFAIGFGSIYPALAELERQKLIERTDKSVGDPRARKVYRITAAGRATLKRALGQQDPPHTLRSEWMAFLYFSSLVPAERVSALLDQRLLELEVRAQKLRGAGASTNISPSSTARFVNGLALALLETTLRYTRENRKLVTQPREV